MAAHPATPDQLETPRYLEVLSLAPHYWLRAREAFKSSSPLVSLTEWAAQTGQLELISLNLYEKVMPILNTLKSVKLFTLLH